uniref:RING-type domain-containing protein n=2 Tax=Populus TaxID=3689 RepID=A0A4U5Q498_POPAL|nr:hypothetical protein D5086_0000138520 [Populus alba]
MDLNWLLQFIFTVFVIGFGLLHLVKNTASKYFEAAESNHTVIDPCTVNQAMEAEEGCCRCVNCGSFGTQRCSRCKSVIYCSLGCQIKHWRAGHRLKCKDFGASSSRTAKSNSKPIIEKPGVTNPNFWEDPVRGTDSHNGWGAAVASTHSAAGGGGWMDEAPREDYNGWGAAVASTHSAAGGGGWMDEAPREDYNGWGVPNMGPSGSQGHVFETSSGNTSSAPSAPPIPDGAFDEEPIHHPSIDFSPPELSVPAIERGASVTSDHVNEGGASSCIICWEAPVEGACNPCGHMAGCMACLSEIKAKKGVCPVCRSNINQVLRLYAV